MTAMAKNLEKKPEIYDNNDGNVDKDWKDWKTKHGKSYNTPEEEEKRKNAWLETRVRVTEHNKKYLDGKETYSQAANQFADLLPGEGPPTGLIMPK
ncbi:hypothetical protein ANANG_G00004400 [Anguilla anguilla]|uniref:Cathepsin propeptide inhibitor domain-containing protein n=1 Tax=Anguilla anguilla TaxID=7936 RepID=A0A9D3MWQ2_ANGAN|nr:hypothetical protein ANANG_G00004400 [Anguilla anguilla]